MSQVKIKPLLNRKETRTLLNTVKVVTATGAVSLTVAGWGLLAQLDVRNGGNAQANQSGAMVVASANAATAALDDARTSARPPTPQPVKKLDIVQWVNDTSGNPVAVVRDVRGTLWFVMGSDVPRLEQGQPPEFQPQLAQRTTRSRAS
jgi:hypothetical protein